MLVKKKYNSYKEFRQNESAAYYAVQRHKWADKIKKIFNDSKKT